ncbi:hypothetical protein H9P43_006037 [Blastocladiella emersonii ATCC 22665]|nr:hypothetical protein H9P43_006037 [Blastocladiella emersonii ATCC 22665]
MSFCRSGRPLYTLNPDTAIDLDLCFQHGVIYPAFALVLLAGLVNRFVFLRSKPALPDDMVSPYRILVGAKLLLALANLALGVLLAITVFGSDSPAASIADYLGLIIILIPLVIAIPNHVLENGRSRRASTSLSTFYGIFVILQLLNLRSLIMQEAADQIIAFTLAQTVVTGVLFLVEGFSTKGIETRPNRAPTVEGARPTPEYAASFLSKLTFWWVIDLLVIARRKVLEFSDLWDLPVALRSGYNCSLLETQWERSLAAAKQSGGKPSFLGALVKTYGVRLVLLLVLGLAQVALNFLTPTFVAYFVSFVASQQTEFARPASEGVIVALMFLACNLLTSVLFGQAFHATFTLQIAVKAAVQNVVYRKGLRVPAHRRETNIGEILNHMQVDATNLSQSILTITELITSPVSLVIALVLLYAQVGWSLFVALVVMLLSTPMLGLFAKLMMRYRVASLEQTDGRVKTITEVLNGVKTIKLYGWQKFLRDRVIAFREKELFYMRKLAGVLAVQIGTSFLIPSFATFGVFAVFALTSPDNSLNESKVFVTLSIMRMLDHPIQALVWGWSPLVEAFASASRITKYLLSDDLDTYVERLPAIEGAAEPVVSIRDGQFSFADDKVVLDVPSLDFEPGTLTAVVGSVGSGKSALLAAILGEIDKVRGSVTVRGDVAFITQQAFILNDTVRNNITFGLEFDKDVYRRVIDACSLRKDLQVLAQGDETMIGEKGISLSGGQKARVACARAVYASEMGKVSVVAADDILAAVDAHVDRHMFNALFSRTSGLLRGKTVILVTHAVHHLPEVDRIVLIRDGTVAETGDYATLMAANGEVTALVNEYMAKRQAEGEDDEDDASSADSATVAEETLIGYATVGATTSDKTLTHRRSKASLNEKEAGDDANDHDFAGLEGAAEDTSEKKGSGAVSYKVYLQYFKYCGYGVMSINFLASALGCAIGIGLTLWLGQWGAAAGRGEGNTGFYLGVYAAITIGNGIINVFSIYFGLAVVAIRGARATFRSMLDRVLRYPLSYFDLNPSGRVLNRFSSDQKNIDVMIPQQISQLQFMGLQTIATLITILVAAPLVIVVLAPVVILFVLIQSWYLSASREIQRVYMVLNSPVFTHFSETLNGLTTIRSFGHQARFRNKGESLFDASSRGFYNLISTNRWLFVQLQLLGNLIVSGVAFAAVTTKTSGTSLVGVALTYSFDLTFMVGGLLRVYAQLENAAVSVERVQQMLEQPTEAAEETTFSLDPEWPARGEISFDGYSAAYRPGLPLVLKDLKLTFEAGKKVGIVGRTGAGKSTMTLALFRIIEAAAGSISIDGLDISTIGLHDLRSRLTILPQDAYLMEASIRDNLLNPTGQRDDAALWSALEGASLATYVRSLDEGLDALLTQSSLSVGQAQLLCLARAILRKSRVLVLDEATASIDGATDNLVQETIRREFDGCTVITIAHRIGTIIDYDKILVLDHGEVAEFDTPEALLARPESVFYSLAKESGLVA